MWEHPNTGMPYDEGTTLTYFNALALTNFAFNYNITSTGTFRIIKSQFILSTTNPYCISVLKEFEFNGELKIVSANTIQCNNTDSVVSIIATGIAPFTYRITTKKYMNYLASKYSTSHFVNLTEKAYWQTVDKSNYIKSKEYNDYRKLKKTNLKSSLNLLEKIVQKTIDFQEYSIYQIELADQYEKKSDSLENNASKLAIEKYKYILDKKKYSIYLFETWLKWRTVTQQHLGISKFSEIPNDKYNKMRKEVAYIILDYITKNDKDAMAINQFTLMATHDIVRRFGEYPYGNQNTIEYHQIFDEN